MKEYVPFDAYGLLRRIVGKGPQRVRKDRIEDNEPAKYLLSRKLARAAGDDEQWIRSTESGDAVGLIDYEPQVSAPEHSLATYPHHQLARS